jgi:hypothetical protein
VTLNAPAKPPSIVCPVNGIVAACTGQATQSPRASPPNTRSRLAAACASRRLRLLRWPEPGAPVCPQPAPLLDERGAARQGVAGDDETQPAAPGELGAVGGAVGNTGHCRNGWGRIRGGI